MLLELEHIQKDYDTGGKKLSVLKDINLQVQEKETIAIVGPSGCGKSTLLNIMGGLDYPSSGKVLFNGQEIYKLANKQLARIRNTQIGFIFQLHHLLPQCTLLENVLIPTLPSYEGHSDVNITERATFLLNRVGLGDRIHHRPGQLSGGECLRTAVVRALINRPALLLADEPTGSLDIKSAQNLGQLLMELNQEEQVALVVVTHSMALANLLRVKYLLREGVLQTSTDFQNN